MIFRFRVAHSHATLAIEQARFCRIATERADNPHSFDMVEGRLDWFSFINKRISSPTSLHSDHESSSALAGAAVSSNPWDNWLDGPTLIFLCTYKEINKRQTFPQKGRPTQTLSLSRLLHHFTSVDSSSKRDPTCYRYTGNMSQEDIFHNSPTASEHSDIDPILREEPDLLDGAGHDPDSPADLIDFWAPSPQFSQPILPSSPHVDAIRVEPTSSKQRILDHILSLIKGGLSVSISVIEEVCMGKGFTRDTIHSAVQDHIDRGFLATNQDLSLIHI